jgi:L-Ala-D/L-Glu epimerase
MNLSWQIVRLNLKETFSIAHGNYSFREALIISLSKNDCKGYGECTAIDYYQINLADFVQKLNVVKATIQNQKITHPSQFYSFLLTLDLPSFLRSAIDCAYWDLFGKLEKRSFLELNGITNTLLPESSITISVAPIEEQIKKIEQSVWTNFKVKCNHFNATEVQSLLQLDKQ